MLDYRWTDYSEEPLDLRYPQWAAGQEEWTYGIRERAFAQRDPAIAWLERIRTAERPRSRTCPRLFVSHRQFDKGVAVRLAWLAWDMGWDYWLDIVHLDPAVNRQTQRLEQSLMRKLTPFEISVLTAAVIEMALINSTHAIAAMTAKTKGSQWVPYEYGRKRKDFWDTTASCWWDTTSLPLDDLPEYLQLAPIHVKESGIRQWLDSERRAKHPACTRSGKENGHWNDDEPASLPTG